MRVSLRIYMKRLLVKLLQFKKLLNPTIFRSFLPTPFSVEVTGLPLGESGFESTLLSALKTYNNIQNIGALIIRIGFWAHFTILILRNHQNSIGNYSGPHINRVGRFGPSPRL